MPYNGKYIPEKKDLYKLSRSKVDFFLNCPRCFYMDRRLGIVQPPGFPFNLNSAVDNLLKNEFALSTTLWNLFISVSSIKEDMNILYIRYY